MGVCCDSPAYSVPKIVVPIKKAELWQNYGEHTDYSSKSDQEYTHREHGGEAEWIAYEEDPHAE